MARMELNINYEQIRHGNKRTAFVVMELFLDLNGWVLNAADADCISTMLSVASGDLSEKTLANWLRAHLVKD
jgi:death on curing protein